MQVAGSCNLNVAPDTVLDREQIIRLKKRCDEICAPAGKPQPRSDEERHTASVRVLEKAVQENVIFVDLSSILAPAGEAAIRNILPLLYRYRKRLFIPQSVMTALMKRGNEAEDPEERTMCRRRYNAIYSMLKAGAAQVRSIGTENSTPAKDLLTAAAYFRMQYSLLFLTQDEKLAADLLSLNGRRPAEGKTIVVKCINKYGFLSNVVDAPRNSGKPFRLYTKPRTGENRVLPVSQTPGQGEYVYNGPGRVGPILLESELGGGGEGTIYRTDTPCVAKIYKPECCTAYRQEKIRKLIDAKVSYTGICFPVSMLYNEHGEFVGYMMMEAKGHPIQSSIFGRQLFARKLPGWKKRDLVQCTITILHKFKYLHDNGIIVGDINPSNILVVSPLEVYFVDTDSYQIDDLPCPVGTPLFTAPEIHQRHRAGELSDFTEIMRTRQNEYFAIATLMFMLMMPGKPPYTHTGGQNIVENILHMHFPYALGERRGQNVPDGTWKLIWSHLPRRLKVIFHVIFTEDESKSRFNVNERLDVEQWIIEMDAYMRTLEKWQKLLEDAEPEIRDLGSRIDSEKLIPGGRVKELEAERKKLIASLPDPESLEIYPTRLKRLRHQDRHGRGRESGSGYSEAV